MFSAVRLAWYLFLNFNRNTLSYWSRVEHKIGKMRWRNWRTSIPCSPPRQQIRLTVLVVLLCIALEGYETASYTKELA